MRRHFIIPDTQVRPGVPLHHFRWLGAAIRKYEPDVVIHLGDHWDFPSLSSYAGNKEGLRYSADVEAGNKALGLLHDAMGDFRPRRKIILRGNHEDRLSRAIEADAKLEGAFSFDHLSDRALGWQVVPYENGAPGVVVVDGLSYAHYFANPNTGRPIGGSATYKLAQIGAPFVMGHVQGYDIGTKQYATGRVIRGIVAGACYLHDEPYKGQANGHDRCAVVLNEVCGGRFSEMPLTIDYLCREFEGMPVKRFLQRNVRDAKKKYSLAR